MTIVDPFEITFRQSVERANKVAGRLLRSPLGAHTSEDVVGDFIETQLRRAKSLPEIQEMLSGSGIYSYLTNVKNDIYRWETAAKRGSGESVVFLDDAEPFLGTTGNEDEVDPIFGTSTPESVLIRK